MPGRVVVLQLTRCDIAKSVRRLGMLQRLKSPPVYRGRGLADPRADAEALAGMDPDAIARASIALVLQMRTSPTFDP